jgi:hypothetical protein
VYGKRERIYQALWTSYRSGSGCAIPSPIPEGLCARDQQVTQPSPSAGMPPPATTPPTPPEGQTHPLTWPPQKTLPPSVTVWKSIDFRQTLARLSCPEESEMVAGFLQKAN